MSASLQQQNLKVSYQYIQWILQTNRGIMGHLYQFTSAAGENDYFTDLDIPIQYNGQTWKANSLRFEGLGRKLSVGVNVDQQTVKIWASPTDTLFGSPFLSAAETGIMDGAILVRYRIIWPFVTGNAATDITNNNPIAVWPLFTGYVASIDKGGVTHIEMKVTSALSRLNVNMPRNYWQPGCLWTLFDSGCTLSQAAYAVDVEFGSLATTKNLPIVGNVPTPVGADGLQNYAQGRILFTSGTNNGLLTLIDGNTANDIVLAYPLETAPVLGDTAIIYPGCSKAYSTCQSKFGNQANFRGFDKVPPIMVSI